jgi:hypothetical protein
MRRKKSVTGSSVTGLPPSYTLTGRTAEPIPPLWTDLQPGDQIVLRRHDSPEIAGEVDIVSEDGTFLWLYQEGGQGRMLVHQSDQFEISLKTTPHTPVF